MPKGWGRLHSTSLYPVPVWFPACIFCSTASVSRLPPGFSTESDVAVPEPRSEPNHLEDNR